MVYGSPADVKLVEQYISPQEFRNVLGNASLNTHAKCLDQVAQETWYSAHSAIAAAPVSRWLLETGSGGFFER
jgi:hypothetical protein